MATITQNIGPDGPLVQVEVGVSRPARRLLLASGRPIPQPVTLTALIDSGAEVTCIDPRATRSLRLMSAPNFATVNAPSTGGLSFHSVTNIQLTIRHPSGKRA